MAFLSPSPLTNSNFTNSPNNRIRSHCCPSLRQPRIVFPRLHVTPRLSTTSPQPQPSPPSPSPTPKPPPTPKTPTSAKPKRLSNPQVVLERFGDTLFDLRVHYTRLFFRMPPTPPPTTRGLRVVVLGAGWGSHSLVKISDLESMASLTVISPRNFFFFTPLLSATAVGTVEFRSIVEPLRKANPLVDYYEASAVDVDIEKKIVRCVRSQDPENCQDLEEGEQENGKDENAKLAFDVPYDVLVVAVGETIATFGVPGARKYAYFLKEISDARKLRTTLIDNLERASLPIWTESQKRNLLHFVVVGGGPTGCEFAGELSDFVRNDLAPRYGEKLVSQIRVTLLQSGKTILNQFESSLQQVALRSFRGRVDVRFDARVSRVDDSHVHLANGDSIAYGVLVWAAGNATRPIVRSLISKIDSQLERNGGNPRKLYVDSWCRVQGAKGTIFAIGDCSQMIDEPLPATAQVAGQQGAFLGRLLSKVKEDSLDETKVPILRDSGDKTLHPFRFLSLGIMAYLGNDQAVVQVEATKDRNIKVGGRVAYALWRSVYAVKQVDVRNRILVLFDYFKSRVFGRDISQF